MQVEFSDEIFRERVIPMVIGLQEEERNKKIRKIWR